MEVTSLEVWSEGLVSPGEEAVSRASWSNLARLQEEEVQECEEDCFLSKRLCGARMTKEPRSNLENVLVERC